MGDATATAGGSTSSGSSGLTAGVNDGWFGRVEWSSVDFATGGDSGSMVFAAEPGVTIPLGIHLGSRGEKEVSYFMSLETFCWEARGQS